MSDVPEMSDRIPSKLKVTLRQAMAVKGHVGYVLQGKVIKKLAGSASSVGWALVGFLASLASGIGFHSLYVVTGLYSLNLSETFPALVFVSALSIILALFGLSIIFYMMANIESVRYNNRVIQAAMDRADEEAEL